jgi:starch-binding outer membrane protein, SusD/RagB family
MKKITYKISLLLFAVATIVGTSCKKVLDIDPQQSIDAATALNSRDNINAAIVGLYARLKSARQYGRDLITHPDALSDNGAATNKSGRLLNESRNVYGAHFTTGIWTNSYAGINNINLILEAIPKLNVTPSLTPAEINAWQAQLFFLRGLYYFDLMRVFAYIPNSEVMANNRGGVPLLLTGTSDYTVALASKPTRPAINDVYNQIVTDLVAANSRFTAFTSTTNVGLANKPANQILLARVELYRRNYAEAKRWADSAIAAVGTRMVPTGEYVTQWRNQTHNETLFQVLFASPAENIGVNESLHTSYTTLAVPGNRLVTQGFGDLVPTVSLLTELGITLPAGNNLTGWNTAIPLNVDVTRGADIRAFLYEPGTTGRGNAKVECTKFMGKNGVANLDNVPLIRISEAYLIRAEAMAAAGSSVANPANALADLKVLKSRRYTGYTGGALETADNALTQAQLFEEILRQRRLEFAFEGHRFFDLKRLARDIPKAPHSTDVSFTDIRILPAILQGDVDFTGGILQQNVGY